MIFKLAVSDLLYRPKVWVGPLIFAFTCGLVCQFAFCLCATGAQFGLRSFGDAGFSILFLTVVSSLPIAAAFSNLVIERRRNSYARWQLIGASPRVVRRTVFIQLGLVAALGSAVGAIVSVMLYEPILPWARPELFGQISAMERRLPINTTTSFPNFLAVCGWSAFVFVVGGRGAVRRASSASPVVALPALERPVEKAPLLRISLAILCFCGAVWCFLLMCGEDRDLMTKSALFFPIVVVLCFSVLAPWLLLPLLRLWSAPLKSFALPNLASKEACHTLASSFTIELAVTVCFGMFCGMFSGFNLLSNWYIVHGYFEKATINPDAQFMLFMCPAIVGLVGAATCALAIADEHAKNAASLILVGVTKKEVVIMSIIESSMHIINALVLGVLSVLSSSFFSSVALGMPLCDGLNLSAGAGVAIAGTVFITSVLCAGSLRGARRAIADANAVARGEV